MNSHIQFPKVVLKQFADEKHLLYYYDFQGKKVLKEYPKKFNTEEDYYDEGIEESFSKNIERPLGIIIKNIKSDGFDKNKPYQNMREIAKDYVYSTIARNPQFLKDFEEKSVFAQFLSGEEKRNYAIPFGLVCAHNMDYLSEFSFGIGVTEKAFILNSDGIIMWKKGLLAPITPNRAFVFYLLKEKQNDSIINLVDLTDDTDYINKIAFEYEKNHNKRFVLAQEEAVLNQLIRQ